MLKSCSLPFAQNKAFFRSLLPPENTRDGKPKTPLQEKLLAMTEGILEADHLSGNAGEQFIEFIKGFMDHPLPPKVKDHYDNFGEFMDFRHIDGGMG